jgi:hypothetical protein
VKLFVAIRVLDLNLAGMYSVLLMILKKTAYYVNSGCWDLGSFNLGQIQSIGLTGYGQDYARINQIDGVEAGVGGGLDL